jgi:hypothetical protein
MKFKLNQVVTCLVEGKVFVARIDGIQQARDKFSTFPLYRLNPSPPYTPWVHSRQIRALDCDESKIFELLES